MGGGVLAAVEEIVARFGERRGGLVLRGLRLVGEERRGLYRVFSRNSLFSRGFRRSGGIAPAGEDEPRFGQPDLLADRAIAFGRPRLPTQDRKSVV